MIHAIRNSKKIHLFLLMGLSSLFCLVLLNIRLVLIDFDIGSFQYDRHFWWMRGQPTFLFMVWNLFLAWIPYVLALMIPGIYRMASSKLLVTILIVVWLLFFPNAPYLITDLIHLKPRANVPFWFDCLMFLTFAWNGFILGILSLMEIHEFLKKQIPTMWAHTLIFCFIQLSGFGIYMGRFLRWNTWDIVTSPFELLNEVLHILIHPMKFADTLGLAVVMSVFMTIGYLTVWVLSNKAVPQAEHKVPVNQKSKKSIKGILRIP